MIEENKNLYEAFLSSLRSSGKSKHTIIAYARGVREFLEFIGNKKFIEIEYADCEDFQSYLFEKGNGSATICLKRSALSCFSKYAKRRYGKTANIENSFLLMDRIPKERIKPLVIWNKDKVLEMINYFQDKDLRLSTLLALALYSGRRKNELTRFKVSDFTDNRLIGNNAFWVTDEIETKGRGSHKMACFVLTGFKPYLDKWLAKRETESEWLFPDKDPTEHINDGIMSALAEKVQRVSAYKDFHWHMIRHTMVTTMLDSGVDTNIVVRIIGWADAKMLMVYDDRDKVNVIDKYFIDNKMRW